jgi:ubiquinone/menaquinone biosynthesis C-methylase UbiE
MFVLDYLFSIGPIRKALWRFWYPFLTRRLQQDDILFLNYAFEEDPPMNIPLSADDEGNRACIQLYHHVASQTTLRGKKVLEVSCGHGGGASYLTRTFEPHSYVGLDLNPAGIDFCLRRHQVKGLTFQQGDAEKLPFENNSFDAVVNVEASHCYPSFPKFLGEVSRVLRAGGHFLYADFRFADSHHEWDAALAAAPLQILNNRLINPEVIRGMTRNSDRSIGLVQRHLPKFLHSLGRDFSGVKGSRIYNGLCAGEVFYRSFCMVK